MRGPGRSSRRTGGRARELLESSWHRVRARWRLILIALLAHLGLLLALWLLVLPLGGRWFIERRVLPLIARRLDRDVGARLVRVSYREVLLEGIQVAGPGDPSGRPLLFVARLRIDYRLGPLLRGRLAARQVLVEGAAVNLLRGRDGRSNFIDILSRRRLLSGGEGRLRIDRLVLQSGWLAARDERHRLVMQAGRVSGELRPGERSELTLRRVAVRSLRFDKQLELGELGVSLRYQGGRFMELPRLRLSGGRIPLLPRLVLSGIRGTIGPHGGRIAIVLDGSYGGAEAKLWSATGWIDPAGRRGAMTVKAARFSLGRIASILGRTPVILPQRTEVDGALDLRFADNVLRFGGQLQVKDLNLFHPALARSPVLDLSGEARLQGRLDLGADRLAIELLDISSGKIDAKVTGFAERLFDRPHLSLRLQVPPVPCQSVLESFPSSLLPQLQGFELGGTFSADIHSDVDYAQLDKVELGGSVGIRRCKVVKVPEEMDAARLAEPFEHAVDPRPGETQAFTVGPENPDFTPFAEISRNMVNAVLTTEDAGFFKHRGFIPSQFRSALARNLQQGGFRLGASTITMQLVKNVLLSREKTLSRKLQELFLTWYVEQTLSKERMMEIYLNVIEFGPGIYGVGAAARHYFGKKAKDLSALEAAFFASILPSPKRRYVQYCRGELSPQWDRYVRRLLKRMAEKGHIDEATLKASEQQRITFARDTDALSAEDCQKEVKELLESWEEEARRRLREAILRAAPHQLDLYLKGSGPEERGGQPTKPTGPQPAPRGTGR